MVKKMKKQSELLEDELRLLTKRILTENINPFDAYIGHMIKMKRKSQKLSQQQVAFLLGVTFQQLQKYEKGTNKISTDKLLDLSHMMNMPYQVFIEGYELFLTHLKNVAKVLNKELPLRISDNEKKKKTKPVVDIKQELKKLKALHKENEKDTSPLEISSIFSKLEQKDFLKFYRAYIEEPEETAFDNLPNFEEKEEDIKEKILSLYKKVYQSIEKNPLGQIVIKEND